MKRLSLLVLTLAVLSLIFLLLLVFLRVPFSPYPLISVQDVIDFFTPLALIPIYWLLFKFAASDEASLGEEIAFMLFAVLWVSGHGMHLAANSINNLAESLALTDGSVYQLAYFYDEHLSHYIWHLGFIGLAGLLVYREWRRPAGEATLWWAVIPAGLIYGFAYFSIFLEGQTVRLGLPFAIIVCTLTLLWGRDRLARQPILAFFFITCLAAVVLLAGWALYWHGFPQFTDVGLI